MTRRLGYSVDYDLMSQYLKFSPSDLVDKIIDEALSKEVTADPGWLTGLYRFKNLEKMNFRDHQRIFFNEFNNDSEKINCWSNHFVTNILDIVIPHMLSDITIHKKMFWNFKDFVYK